MKTESRIAKRITWNTNVYKKDGEVYLFIGVLANISKSGVNLCISDSEVNLGDRFGIRIELPEEMAKKAVDIEVTKVWNTSFDDSYCFNMLGFQFENLTEKNKEELIELFSYLEWEQKFSYSNFA